MFSAISVTRELQASGARWLMTVALAAFGGCCVVEVRDTVHASIPSPNGRWMAYLYSSEGPGGALADTTFTISIGEIDDLRKPWQLETRVWSADDMSPLYFFWLDDSTIEVLYPPSSVPSQP